MSHNKAEEERFLGNHVVYLLRFEHNLQTKGVEGTKHLRVVFQTEH